MTGLRPTHHFGRRPLQRGVGLIAAAVLAGCGAQAVAVDPTPSLDPTATATATATPSPTADPTPTASLRPTFQPIDVWATPSPTPSKGALPTDQIEVPASRRPVPAQSADWLAVKAAGRLALIDGQPTVLLATADPLAMPRIGQPVPSAWTLETDYARWIIEPLGKGKDAKGNTYEDKNFWNYCEVGASAVALYYWQQVNGHPNVTGTEGYFIDPYDAEGVAWPSPGPELPMEGEKLLGMYWTGEDRVNGYTAYARGYQAYLGMEMQPPGWKSIGMAVHAINGKAIYRTFGAPRTNIQVALNWEASGHDRESWVNYWYTGVMRFAPNFARDLQMAVTLDVGRDGVPVVAVLDTSVLPNWQDGLRVKSIVHAVAIVGYDNTASPPTYTYIDTCARVCNSRPGNRNGGLYVIAQDKMVEAIQGRVGSGFVW